MLSDLPAPYEGLQITACRFRAQDFGELTVSLVVAALFLVPVSVLCWSHSEGFRHVSKHLVVLLLALTVFGIVVDMLHVAIDMGWKISFLLGVIEDGPV